MGAIARQPGHGKSTISRELARDSSCSGDHRSKRPTFRTNPPSNRKTTREFLGTGAAQLPMTLPFRGGRPVVAWRPHDSARGATGG